MEKFQIVKFQIPKLKSVGHPDEGWVPAHLDG